MPNTIFEQQAEFLAAMANEKRIQILHVLTKGEITVGELAIKVGLSQSALSQHLARLKKSQLVTARRNSQKIFYSSDDEGVKKMLRTLEDVYELKRTRTVG